MYILYLILAIIVIVVLLFLVYAVLPTVIMRVFSLGVFNKSTVPGKIALTFDDGPDPQHTPRLLTLLHKYHVKATFFVVGEFADNHPEIIKRMVQEGHSIGIHHYRHKSNWFLTPWQTKYQCERTAEVIEKITGRSPVYYRPPWGHMNLFAYFVARPYKLVTWSEILGDWSLKLGSDRLYERLHRSLYDGSIIVLHDSNQSPGADEGAAGIMIDTLEDFLSEVDGRFDFITIDELYKEEEAIR